MNVFVVIGIVLSLPYASGFTEQDSERCTSDTWGVATEDNSRPFLDIDPKKLVCGNKVHSQFKDLKQFAVNWYPDIASFQSYDGIDLNPARHHEYAHWKGKQWGRIANLSSSKKPPFWNQSAQLSTCEIKEPDGYIYRIQDVGPFTSTGGYDFWQFGWKDTFGLTEVLQEHPDGIIFDSTFSAAVLPDGTPLGLPPIHIHHIHVGPRIGVKSKEATMPLLAMEQHGDYECSAKDGGTRCLFEKTPKGYGKLLREPLDLEGELNDVRAFNSIPMTWYYRIMIRYRPYSPRSSLIPLSQSFITGPGPIGEKQLNTLTTFPVPTDEDSIYWYTVPMQASGNMVRNKLHSHNIAYNRSFFFHATPEQLGLGTSNMKLSVPPEGCQQELYSLEGQGCIPKRLSETGFKDFNSLEEFMFLKLAAAQKNAGDTPTPHLICESTGARKEIRDPVSGKKFFYDRRAPVCCKPWRFTAGDTFTVVAFINKVTQPVGPWAPNDVPRSTDMHIHWVMSYDEELQPKDSLYRIHNIVSAAKGSLPMGSYPWADVKKLMFVQTSSHAMDKKAEYIQIFGALMVFILGGYIACKCSSESQSLTRRRETVCARCCPPCTPRLKSLHVQYHTV